MKRAWSSTRKEDFWPLGTWPVPPPHPPPKKAEKLKGKKKDNQWNSKRRRKNTVTFSRKKSWLHHWKRGEGLRVLLPERILQRCLPGQRHAQLHNRLDMGHHNRHLTLWGEAQRRPWSHKYGIFVRKKARDAHNTNRESYELPPCTVPIK